ncbi:hypothetical protein M0R72_06000 [Candidatus Pacearchaeota archaeon]|jgi:hypothetical protein|nr:hypothetical protein [Candidatus Pacearchaeota archaeon]
MEIRIDDHVISVAGLSPWKRFLLLCGLTGVSYKLTVLPGIEPTYIGGAWAMVLMAWTFYFTTHKNDTTPEPTEPATQSNAPREKSKLELEQEIFNGSGTFINKKD